MNSITDLLNLENSDINISNIIVKGQTKTLIIETPPIAQYWPTLKFGNTNGFTLVLPKSNHSPLIYC